MKRLVAVCALIITLSSSVLAGHNTPGLGWCECNEPEVCSANIVWDDEEQMDVQQYQSPNGEVSELDSLIDALLIFVKF
jgi:hypothetical protein